MEHLRRSGSDAECTRVGTAQEMRTALDSGATYDAVVCDTALAEMGVAAALAAVGRSQGGSPLFMILDAEGEEVDGTLQPIRRDATAPSELAAGAPLLRGLLEAAPDAMLVIDFVTGLQIYNRRFADMWNVQEGSA
ncbi:MAG TPA: hypothetical protein VFL80_08485, partial [Thermoanaerobaculia bacterium]|nr:hypothetical protein [Thermoanaerobaculia bacterium]